MHNNKNNYSLKDMAKVLKVSPKGYNAWLNRRPCECLVDKLIIEIFNEHKGRAGAAKIQKELTDRGYSVSERTVSRYMQRLGLRSVYRRKFKKTTDSSHDQPVSPNLLKRDFETDNPNEVWVSDITYIRAGSSWLYLCVIIDLYNREVVSWSLGKRMKASLLIEAYLSAVKNRCPGPGLIFHSDRGSQYASKKFRRYLEMFGHRQSMSRKGDCWDNAVAESFFKTLKVELIYQEFIGSFKNCRRLLFEYINIYYNKKRRHSYLGYVSPANFRQQKAA